MDTLTLNIPDMSCGGCAAGVQKAIAAVDPAAQVRVDLPARQVEVQTSAPAARIAQAVQDAGFEVAAA